MFELALFQNSPWHAPDTKDKWAVVFPQAIRKRLKFCPIRHRGGRPISPPWDALFTLITPLTKEIDDNVNTVFLLICY